MTYEVAQSHGVQDEWRVEAVDDDGAIHVTLFSGPQAQPRAREYARWKNHRERRT